ncbi:hypothetical protein JW916_16440 [Candidatus Sumerlaeota bacterium]|nr:hypothetical protein [Candidatus Sumerlaeota bacterium]
MRPSLPKLALLSAAVAFIVSIPAPRLNAQSEALLARRLSDHGVAPSPVSLLAFLERGWDAANPPNPLPEDPADKSTLLIDAWQLLSLERDKVAREPRAVSAASALALRYARGDLPPGARRMIEEDLVRLTPGEQPQERARRLAFHQYNGMMALGVFGVATPDFLAAARTVFDAETDPVVRVAYARTLALLGDASILDYLVAEASLANSTSSVAAASVLYVLFGRVFDMTAVSPAVRRREASEAILTWWVELAAQGDPEIDREAAFERMTYRPPARPPSLASLRDLLRASADVSDFADKRGSRTAWNRLETMGPGLSEQLLPIVRDQREDLDIRGEAMRWYRRIEGKGAKRVLKKLRKDPNPEIVNQAKTLLAQPVE